MRGNETRYNMHEIQEGFERLGLGDVKNTSYPGAQLFTKQYKRCSVLREAPITYSSSSTCKTDQ